MAALASDLLRHFWLLWNGLTEFNETWQEAKSQRPLPSLCFSGWSEKQDGCPCLWFAEKFTTYPLKLQNRIQQNMTGCNIPMSSTKFVLFGTIGTKIATWPLIDRDIFDFSSETTERIWRNLTGSNSTKLPGSKISTSSTKFEFLGLIGKIKMAALASDWLRHFRLLLWNRWMEFKETWHKATSQCPLPSLCTFFMPIWKTRWPPWPRLAEKFTTYPLKPLNWIQQKITRSKIPMSSTKIVFLGRSENQDHNPSTDPEGGPAQTRCKFPFTCMYFLHICIFDHVNVQEIDVFPIIFDVRDLDPICYVFPLGLWRHRLNTLCHSETWGKPNSKQWGKT